MTYEAVQKHPRFRVSAPVDVVADDGHVLQLRLDDVSLGGVYIATKSPPAPGSFVRMRLPVGDDAQLLSVMGRVVHVLDERASSAKHRLPGMGVQFDGLAPDVEGALRRFVDALVARDRRAAAQRAAAAGAALAVVLGEARRLVEHAGSNDVHAALGLPKEATFEQALRRAHDLARAFAAAFEEASPPQRARLEEAGTALAALEASLWARAAAAPPPVDFGADGTGEGADE